MELLTIIFLAFLFFAISFFCFFIVICVHNYARILYSPKPKKKYSISFLVPAYNEEKTIKETIETIFNSKYPIREVIVLNDGSKDRTKEIVEELQKKYKKLKLWNKENSGKADSLNQGIKIAKGELVAITDADSYPCVDAVEKMVGFFNDPKVAAVTSCVFLKKKNSFFEKIQEIEYILMAWNRKLLDFLDAVYVTNGPLSIYRRDALLSIGGFDVNSLTEDIEITWHLLSKDYKTRMSLNSRVYTTAPNQFKPWWRQRVRWGIGGIETLIKYRKFFLKKGIFGFFIIPFVFMSILLAIIAFIFSFFVLFRNIFIQLVYAGYSISLQSSLLRTDSLNFHPTIILILILILFFLSFFYTSYVFLITEQKHIIKPNKVFNRLFYMLFYLTCYPIVWFDVIYRIIKKDRRW